MLQCYSDSLSLNTMQIKPKQESRKNTVFVCVFYWAVALKLEDRKRFNFFFKWLFKSADQGHISSKAGKKIWFKYGYDVTFIIYIIIRTHLFSHLYMWKQEWTNESSDLSDEFDDFSRIEFNILDYKLINSFQQAIGKEAEKLT